jgi:hypothetical protein
MPRSPQFTPSGVVYNDQVTIASVAGGAATGNSGAVSAADWSLLRLNVRNVSFVGGTAPSVTPVVEHSADGSTGWSSPPGTPFGALTAGQAARSIFYGLDRFIRVRWTTTGTPTSVSFVVDGEAV